MSLLLRSRRARPAAPVAPPSASRPVVLATIEAPLTAEASAFAVDAAVESGQPLIVVNAVESSLQPCALVLGYDTIVPPDVEESLRAPAELARSLGVTVERLRLRSPRPVDALLELVSERRPGLLVLGPEPARMRSRALRKATRRIRNEAGCLVWATGPDER
jgi:nucleotide-binding universal stress UspA family protein